MSVTGISSSSLLYELLQAQGSQMQTSQTQSTQSSQSSELQQIQQDFNTLGQDLGSGNLTQAQQDFDTLKSALSSVQSSSSNGSSSGNSAIQQAYSQLEQDLQAGNLTGAQQDYSSLQQSLQAMGGLKAGHHHHHHGNSEQAQAVQQDFGSLGQALSSGNLSNAQSAFASLQQDLQNYSASGYTYSANSTSSSPASAVGNSSELNVSG
jgi:chromosome segregation ATPase